MARRRRSPPQVAGNIAFTLVYASPYLLALIASRAGDPGVRGSLLAALGLLSLVASFSTFSLVTVVLLPATFILWFASVRSLAASGRPLATSLPAAVVGLLIAATVGLGSSPSGESKTTRPVAGSCLTTPTSPTGSPGPISGNLECSLPEPWTSTLAATARATSSQARKPPWASAPQSPPS